MLNLKKSRTDPHVHPLWYCSTCICHSWRKKCRMNMLFWRLRRRCSGLFASGLLQICKSWDGLEKMKILYMLFFFLFCIYCHVYSEASKTNISNFFGLSYGNEDIPGLQIFLFISFTITTPKLCWSCLGVWFRKKE